MGRIVVGVDGSGPSKQALRWASHEAARSGGTLEVVMAWDNPYRDMWLPHDPPGTDPLGHLRKALDRTIAAVLGDPPPVPVKVTVAEGHPAQVLLDTAAGAELLVVGNRGRGELSGAVLGSVSMHVAARAPCPVVVVRGDIADGDGPA